MIRPALACLILFALAGCAAGDTASRVDPMERYMGLRTAWDAPKTTPADFRFPAVRWALFSAGDERAQRALEQARGGADLDALFREGARLVAAGSRSVADVRQTCSTLPPEDQDIAPCKAPERGDGLGVVYVEPGSSRQVMGAYCCANPYIPRYQALSRNNLVVVEYLKGP